MIGLFTSVTHTTVEMTQRNPFTDKENEITQQNAYYASDGIKFELKWL